MIRKIDEVDDLTGYLIERAEGNGRLVKKREMFEVAYTLLAQFERGLDA